MQHTATVDAVSPVRFDHRFIRKVLELSGFDGPVSTKEYDTISRVFSRLGGSWEAVAKGDPAAIHRLKTIVKFAVKKDFISKKD